MFTDKEYRILLAALGREKKICKQVDKELIHEPCENTLVDICKSIERKIHDAHYKYRWHDLRKNHNDVPKDCVLYVYTKLKNGRYTVSLWNHYEFPAYPEGTDLEVIAWREIEPFEEDE